MFIQTKYAIRDAARAIPLSRGAFVEWWQNSRKLITGVMKVEPKLDGATGTAVQVDGSYFSGRRKYHYGRLLDVNMRSFEAHKDDFLMWWNASNENKN